MNILQVQSLSKTYPNAHQALCGVTFDVPSGSLFGLLGSNGAGKTTLINIVAGLLRQESGRVMFEGVDIASNDSVKRRIGFVLDKPLYFEWMSAGEYLEFVGTMYGITPDSVVARTSDLLEFLGLGEAAESPIRELSTGTKKKVSLAAAIIHTPDLLVLDEPFESIDAVAVRTIKDILQMLLKRGTTICITSHVLDTIENLCTEIAVMHRGEVLIQCPTSDVRTRLKHSLTNEAYANLEELFLDLVGGKPQLERPSWI